jgi:hypothetical protein
LATITCSSAWTITGGAGGGRSSAPPTLTSIAWPGRTGRLATFTRARSTNTPPASITARALRRDSPATCRGMT